MPDHTMHMSHGVQLLHAILQMHVILKLLQVSPQEHMSSQLLHARSSGYTDQRAVCRVSQHLQMLLCAKQRLHQQIAAKQGL